MLTRLKFFQKAHYWRLKYIPHNKFVIILSLAVGLMGGLAAIILKNTVFYTHELLTHGFAAKKFNLLYLAYPFIGMLLTVIYVKLFVRDNIGHGISRILYSISKNNSILRSHNTYSSMIGSTLTVGFGGSVGLEAPIALTGAAIGSNLGRILRLDYKTVTLLVACGASAAIAGIFKAPIAGVIFSLEVLMIDLTMSSLVPLLVSAVTGATLASILMGKNVIFAFTVSNPFELGNIPFYVLLGVICGFISLYFTRANFYMEGLFQKINNTTLRLVIGGTIVSVLIFLFPSLFGEGYRELTAILNGNGDSLFQNSLFYSVSNNYILFLFFLLLILFSKVIAMTATNAGGGVGGIFAPSLFMGGITGFFVARSVNFFEPSRLPEKNFALAGMAGIMAGVMHAPLTAIFLIAEITGGYSFFIPLIITSTVSYLTIMNFEPHSLYTKRLAQQGELITHHKDKAVLTRLSINDLIEKNFKTISPEASLGDLVKVVTESKRNVFPVIKPDRTFLGVVFINDIRNIIFKPELYETTFVHQLMFMPDACVEIDETMEDVAQKFQTSSNYNLPVLDKGKYVGFVSKANVFAAYRKIVKEFSQD
ncbi:MAG: chloride channel protein [Porphyromonadaceae bacterium]|nr:MAG: chloride channel protein [Porphyromonadaceae bacterium]